MKMPILSSVLGIAMLMSAPAFAQSSSGSSANSGTTASGTTASGTSSTSDASESSAMKQDKVRQSLEDAGFKNVSVMDAAYLIQAETEDGETVFMMLNPPMTGSGTMSSEGATSGSTSSGSSTSGGTSGSATSGSTAGEKNQ